MKLNKNQSAIKASKNLMDTNGKVIMLTAPSVSSVRSARSWFKNNEVEVIERSAKHDMLTVEEVMQLITMTENGVDDLLATRSKAYKEYASLIEEGSLRLSQMAELIANNYTILSFPIIVKDGFIMSGFNSEDAMKFLPREHKLRQLKGIYRVDRLVNGLKTHEIVEEI